MCIGEPRRVFLWSVNLQNSLPDCCILDVTVANKRRCFDYKRQYDCLFGLENVATCKLYSLRSNCLGIGWKHMYVWLTTNGDYAGLTD